ncbi:MAG: LPS assembly lipoprotein LptE, partial [Planctomycetota bacterium]|nr:LPS assembly lipoprotein LptE [Planctomycetota bacterium]
MTRTTLIPEDQNEVYVPYFENKTFIRSLGLNLTEQVKAAILLRPGVSIVSKEDAEVYLTGRIVAKSQRVLSEDVNQVVTSETHTVTVEVDILDAMTGDL